MNSHLSSIAEKYLNWVPASLCVRELSRISVFEKVTSGSEFSTILDIGCGDGKWWELMGLTHSKKIYGIDINPKEIKLASQCINAKVLDISTSDYNELKNQSYDLIVGNCSLEHIYDIHSTLLNIRSLCHSKTVFILFVPSPKWIYSGKILNKLLMKAPRIAMSISGLFNGFFQHWHLMHCKTWTAILNQSNFVVEEVSSLGTRKSNLLFRLFLPTSLISFFCKTITGRYLNFYTSKVTPIFLKRYFAKIIANSITSNNTKDLEDINVFEYALICRLKDD